MAVDISGPMFCVLRRRALPPAVKGLAVAVSEFGEEAAAVVMALVAGEGVLEARCREMQGE